MKWLIVPLLVVLAACGNGVAVGPLTYPTPTPPLARPLLVSETQRSFTIASSAATITIAKADGALSINAVGGVMLAQSAAPPTLKVGDTLLTFTRLESAQPVAASEGNLGGLDLTYDAGTMTAVFRIVFLTPGAIATRLRPADPVTVSRVITSLHAEPDEHYYGLTERIVDAPSGNIRDRQASEVVPQEVGSLDRRGQTITMIVNPTIALYAPLVHSSRGYGVYVEGTMPGLYDLAKTNTDTVSMDFEFNQRTGEHGVVYFVGDHDTILDEYTALTGRPFVPPDWGFRHWRWRDEHALGATAQLDGVDMNAQFVEDITMYEQLGIPIGSYEFDRPWTSGTTDRGQEGYTSFTFDPTRFPNSIQMLSALHQRGYHVFVFGAPWALGDNAVDAERFGYYAPRNDILIDFTNPAAVAWWQGRVQTLIDQGINGMKLDRAELQPTATELIDMPDRPTDIWFDGRNGREMKNAYAPLFARVHHDAFRERVGSDFLHYLRAGYAGSQRYGIFWGGDITGKDGFGLGLATDLGLRSAIQSLAHVAFIGFPIWGTDTGGYYEFGDRELFARWLEFSALCPIMEIGGHGAHAPWDMPTDPNYDSEMIDIYRRYVTLHHELVPLLYSLGLDAHATGRPLARPLVFDFPDDPHVADLWDEFLLGHDLLVAPVWRSGARSRDVYFPDGTWIDATQPSRRITGPLTMSVDASLEHLPLFVRAGGIIPLDVRSVVTGNGSAASAGRLTIDAYPSGTSSFLLHEATGDTTITVSDAACGSSCVRLSITSSQRGYIVRILTATPAGVTLDGDALIHSGSFPEWETAEAAWFHDAQTGRLWVRFATSGSAATLEVP